MGWCWGFLLQEDAAESGGGMRGWKGCRLKRLSIHHFRVKYGLTRRTNVTGKFDRCFAENQNSSPQQCKSVKWKDQRAEDIEEVHKCGSRMVRRKGVDAARYKVGPGGHRSEFLVSIGLSVFGVK